MMSLLRDIDPHRYTRRTYIVSSGDAFSSSKAEEIEKLFELQHSKKFHTAVEPREPGSWALRVVPRARKIHQPLYTTPFSALWCLLDCLRALYETSQPSGTVTYDYPDALITNGPATAVIVILAASVLKFFGLVPLSKMKTIYVESWARVQTLSLSGKILLWTGICDRFLVQWEALAIKINGSSARKKVEWVGFLVE
jgi:beta-1,4-N-acetylglucosaminyltransferase